MEAVKDYLSFSEYELIPTEKQTISNGITCFHIGITKLTKKIISL